MQIFVRDLDGKGKVQVEVEADFTVLDVKELICHGACRRPEGSVSEALGVPPPHVRLMWGCKELDDSCTLEASKVKPGMTLDLFACHLCSAQVYVQKDWERMEGPGLTGSGRRFLPQAWTRQNGTTAMHLRHWVAATCDIDAEDVVVEAPDGSIIADDFSDWASLLDGSSDVGVTVTTFRYVDAPCADVLVIVGEETFPGTREVLLWIPFFAAALAGSTDAVHRVEVKDVDLPTFRIIWDVICADDGEDFDALLGELPQDQLWRLLGGAHYFGMKSLHRAVELRLQGLASNITPDMAASWVARARQHKATLLQKVGLDFVSKHGREVLLSMASGDWLQDLDSYESIVVAAFHRQN